MASGFTTLWIYTILKLDQGTYEDIQGFTTLWIYTILKRMLFLYWHIGRFTTLWIYTILKPISCAKITLCKFYYLMNLHYSQTLRVEYPTPCRFTTLWIYTILKLYGFKTGSAFSFTTLWIYTILKQAVGGLRVLLVLLPYEFTLFSNKEEYIYVNILSFTTLWIYTILKLGGYKFIGRSGFTTLWIYTILKLKTRFCI